MRKYLFHNLIAATVLSVLVVRVRAATTEYNVTNLGNFIPLAINAEGDMTGRDIGTNQAAIYTGATASDIGASTDTEGFAINSSDEVVGGNSLTVEPVSGIPPFIYSASNGVMNISASAGTAFGINNSGEVVGDIQTVTGGGRGGSSQGAFISNGSSTNLLTAPGAELEYAFGINDSGKIAGQATFSSNSGRQDAYIYDTSTSTIEDLGTLGGSSSLGFAINATAEVAGTAATTTGMSEAFLWNGSEMVGLGSLGTNGSTAFGLNDNGQVVGDTSVKFATNPFGDDAFLYSSGIMTDLNSVVNMPSGWSLFAARGINDAGQIVALAVNASYQEQGVLLTPIAPLPEPMSGRLTLLGLIAATILHRSAASGRVAATHD